MPARPKPPARRRPPVLPMLLLGGLCASVATLGAVAWQGAAAAEDDGVLPPQGRQVRPEHVFGLQYVPKFDERKGRGAWEGTRDRGMAMHRDLGVQTSREGFIWRHFEPTAPGLRPTIRDFDDVVHRLDQAGIAMQAMVTESPLWAATAPRPDPKRPETYRSAPPRGLHTPIFTDGTDTPGPGKRVNPENTWAQVLAAMVGRYRGQVRYWQMWNEPDYPKGDQAANYNDTGRSWFGSVDDYVRLLRVGHTIVKWIDPSAQVVTGGIGYGTYLEAMLTRGAGAYFDQVDFHAYGWPGSDTALRQFLKVHDELRGVLVRHGLEGKGLICSETGYTSLDPGIQAEYIAKLYPTAIALGVESVMYYANVNPSWKHMGLIDWRTMSQRTRGYWAYKTASTALRGVRSVKPLALGAAKGYRFEAPGGPVMVAWAPGRSAASPLAVTLPLGAGQWQERDMEGRLVRRFEGRRAALKLTSSPVWLDGRPAVAYAPPRENPPLPHPGLGFKEAFADVTSDAAGAAWASIDLDNDTHWSSPRQAARASLTLALRQPKPVSRLRLKTGPTPEGTWFDVEVSQDGKAFRPVATQQRLTSWKMEELRLPASTLASHLRLRWHNPSGKATSFSVFEVEAY